MVKPQSPTRAGGRIIALDGIRGLCALAVVLYHVTLTKFPAHGYLSVDMFFLVSGYVVAGAYEARLAQGMTITRFFFTRMGRLYPLYLFGMAFGAFVVARVFSGAVGLSGFVAAIFFLPSAVPGEHWMYNLNVPMWSLIMEIIANMLFAAGGFRLGKRALLAIAGASGVAMVVLCFLSSRLTLGAGTTPYDFVGGFARIMFSFPLGVVIYRLHRDGRLPQTSVGQKTLLATIIVPLFSVASGPLIDCVCVACLFPCALMTILTTPQTTGRTAAVYDWLGRYSYPVYATHVVLFSWLSMSAGMLGAWMVPVILVACYGLAICAHTFVELPGKKLFDRLTQTKELTNGLRSAT